MQDNVSFCPVLKINFTCREQKANFVYELIKRESAKVVGILSFELHYDRKKACQKVIPCNLRNCDDPFEHISEL